MQVYGAVAAGQEHDGKGYGIGEALERAEIAQRQGQYQQGDNRKYRDGDHREACSGRQQQPVADGKNRIQRRQRCAYRDQAVPHLVLQRCGSFGVAHNGLTSVPERQSIVIIDVGKV